MIPQAQIAHWAVAAPWPTRQQVEQDLVLSRLIVEIANHPLLGEELAFRGGTCLHKLHLPAALRYSEDLDYVRTSTGPLDELLSTKLRALYQRRKGRDLFDLWHAMTKLETDDAQIAAGLAHYMRDKTFTYPQLTQNIKAKLTDRDFANDLSSLTVSVPDEYALEAAADLVIERLGSRLRNAPGLADIVDGHWRADR